ncbi:hypothetical protein OMR07_27720, partial [Methylobacterium organophilum]|nr:hypothetical protein [Methylobacterium organophilum]
MTFLKTLLASLALCAALLVWAGYAIGPERPTGRTGPGLTAAAVLASDGMAPDGRPGEPAAATTRAAVTDPAATRRSAATAIATAAPKGIIAATAVN